MRHYFVNGIIPECQIVPRRSTRRLHEVVLYLEHWLDLAPAGLGHGICNLGIIIRIRLHEAVMECLRIASSRPMADWYCSKLHQLWDWHLLEGMRLSTGPSLLTGCIHVGAVSGSAPEGHVTIVSNTRL